MEIIEYLEVLFGRKFWSAALFSGGLIFLAYFIYIGFIPELDITALVYLLLAAAFVGVFLVAYLALANILPAIVWQAAVIGKEEYKEFGLDAGKYGHKLWFGLSFLPTLVGVLTVLSTDPGFWMSWAIFVGGLVVSLTSLITGMRLKKISTRIQLKYILAWTLSWCTFAIPLMFIFFFLSAGIRETASPIETYSYLFGLPIIAVIWNVIAVRPDSDFKIVEKVPERWRPFAWSTIVGLSTVLVLTIVTRSAWMIPNAVMRAYGLGGDINVSLILNEEGWRALSLLSIPSDGQQGNTYRVEHVLLRFRLGNQYVFSHDQSGQFSLPKSYVLAMRNEQPHEVKKNPKN